MDVIEAPLQRNRFKHTTRYLAEKLRRSGALREATAAKEMERRREESQAKKRKLEHESAQAEEVGELQELAFKVLIQQMDEATKVTYKQMYGDRWEEGKAFELQKLAKRQEEHQKEMKRQEEREKKRKWADRAHQEQLLKGPPGGVFLDDIDPRY